MIYIPEHIQHEISKGTYFGSLDCAVLFADLAGFSRISQEVMTQPKSGVEIISQIIENAFKNPIEVVYKYHGFISTFIGDAFIAIFPVNYNYEKASERALKCVKEILLFLEENNYQIKKHKFKICFKIGLSLGSINWSFLDRNENSLYAYYGKPVKMAIKGQNVASKNEVIFCEKFFKAVFPQLSNVITIKEKNSYFYKIINSDSLLINPVLNLSESFIEKKKLSKTQKMMQDLKEFRQIISIYLEIKNQEVAEKILDIYAKFQEEHNLAAPKFFNADKGWNLLFFIGAPISVSKPDLFVKNFFIELAKSDIDHLDLKAGIAEGSVYSGYIGSDFRKEFTCLGLCVNLSCRLMQKADWGQILASQSLAAKINFKEEFIYKGKASFKGNLTPEKFYLYPFLLLKNEDLQSNHKFFKDSRISKLYNEIYSFIHNFETRKIVFITGPSGVGKSDLIDDFKIFISHEVDFCKKVYKFEQTPDEQVLFSLFKKILYEISSDIVLALNRFKAIIEDSFHEFKSKAKLNENISVLEALLVGDRERLGKKKYNISEILKSVLLPYFNLKPALVIVDDFNKLIGSSFRDLNYLHISCKNLILIISMRKIAEKIITVLNGNYEEIAIKNLTRNDFRNILQKELTDFRRINYSLQFELTNHLISVLKGNSFYLHEFITSFNSIYENSDVSNYIQLFQKITNNVFLYRFDLLPISIRIMLKILAVYQHPLVFKELITLYNTYFARTNQDIKVRFFQESKLKVELKQACSLGFIKYNGKNLSFTHKLVADSIKELILAKELELISEILTEYLLAKNSHYETLPNVITGQLANLYQTAGNTGKSIEYLFLLKKNFMQNQRYEEAFNILHKITNLILTENEYLSFLAEQKNFSFLTEYQKAKLQIIEYNLQQGNISKASLEINNLKKSDYNPIKGYYKAKYDFLGAKLNFVQNNFDDSKKLLFNSYKYLREVKDNEKRYLLLVKVQHLYFDIVHHQGNFKGEAGVIKALVKNFKKYDFKDERFILFDVLGKYYKAHQYFKRADSVFKSQYEESKILGDPLKQCQALENQFELHLAQMEFSKAIEVQKRQLDLADQLSFITYKNKMLIRLANLNFLNNNFKLAYKKIFKINDNEGLNLNSFKLDKEFCLLAFDFFRGNYIKCDQACNDLLKKNKIVKTDSLLSKVLKLYHEAIKIKLHQQSKISAAVESEYNFLKSRYVMYDYTVSDKKINILEVYGCNFRNKKLYILPFIR